LLLVVFMVAALSLRFGAAWIRRSGSSTSWV
jgi:hypothetical protein